MRFLLALIFVFSFCSGYNSNNSFRDIQNNPQNKKSCSSISNNAPIGPINQNLNRDRNIEIPINYHKIYVMGDSIIVNVTVDNQNTEHAIWDIRGYTNNTFLFYPGYSFDFPGHSYSTGWVLPAGNYSLFLYDEFGSGGISATVTTRDGTVLASINQGQWQFSTFLDFTAPNGELTEGLISNNIIESQTNVLNNHYNDLVYSFTINSIDSASNAGWYYATDSHLFETGQWDNEDQYLIMAQDMAIDVENSINFYWTGAYYTSGLGVYPWSFDEDDARHGLFCANYTHPGSIGTFSEGITAIHEIGHYFGLYHTFENGCGFPGDEVEDTPTQFEPNYGCPINNYSCGNYDDIGNYMDYSDDVCLNHFTDGQKNRMAWALETYRPQLISQNYLGDLNNDNEINIMDVLIIIGIILGNQSATEEQLINGDINQNEILNITDLLLIVAIIINI
jgi:hypothetical protein